MKISSIFILTQGVAATNDIMPLYGADEMAELKEMADNMLAAPAFDMLSDVVKQKWADRFQDKMGSGWGVVYKRCGDASKPAMSAFTAPAFDDVCNDPKIIFDRVAAWAQHYLSGCRSGAADRITYRMQQWTQWMFRRTGCGYTWTNADDRHNNGHFLAAGDYIIDNRCNANWVSKNGNTCADFEAGGWCYSTAWTTNYVFAPTGLHIMPLTGLETEFGIQTAYSCPQCGCTGVMNTDSDTKPADALYPAPSGK